MASGNPRKRKRSPSAPPIASSLRSTGRPAPARNLTANALPREATLRSDFDPDSVAESVLRAVGLHPTMPRLNDDMFPFVGHYINQNSDLSTIDVSKATVPSTTTIAQGNGNTPAIAPAASSQPSNAPSRARSGAKIYVEAGVAPASFKDPVAAQRREIAIKATGLPNKHAERYVCFVQDCAWGTNSFAKEVSKHFKNGAHPGIEYDVSKVIVVRWDDWLADTDLRACAAATTQAEFDAIFQSRQPS